MTAYSPDPRHLDDADLRRRPGSGNGSPSGASPGSEAEAGTPEADALARAARYSRWDGTQRIPALDADEILDALKGDLLAEGDLREALRRLMERGLRSDDPTRPGLAGLDELLERLERRREELLARNRLGDVLQDVREELESIVAEERRGLERRLAEASEAAGNQEGDSRLARMLEDLSRKRLETLGGLPSDVGDRLRALGDYDFAEPSARERYDGLVERLRGKVLDQYMSGLSDAIRSMRPEDLDATREMVRDLNRLLQERLEGGDPDPSEFLAKHGAHFPGAKTLDDVIEQLAERMAAMQSLLRSLSPDQRAELQSMMDALLRDDRLRWDLAQLSAAMDQLVPGGLGDRYRFTGSDPMGLGEALDQLGELTALDRMADTIGDAGSPDALGQVDREALGRLVGDDAVAQVDALERLAERLEEAGYLRRRGDRLELTPRGSRRIGQSVLDDLFAKLRRDAFGGHRIDRAGRGGEREETTKPYEFGDRFDLDLRRTLSNALLREENAPGRRAGLEGAAARAVRFAPGDFEVYRTEEMTRAATVLLLDMSRSMLLRGCYVAAKQVAIALSTLIRTQFPRDDLAIVGFAYYARELPQESLAELDWHGYEYGTNLQHGLLLARRLLAKTHAATKEIVVITDGEPTAHFENGQVEFNYPPTRRTISETLAEVERCTREGITINTFMLERSPALAAFVNEVTRRNRGRAFYADPENLGEYVLVDFVARRTKVVS